MRLEVRHLRLPVRRKRRKRTPRGGGHELRRRRRRRDRGNCRRRRVYGGWRFAVRRTATRCASNPSLAACGGSRSRHGAARLALAGDPRRASRAAYAPKISRRSWSHSVTPRPSRRRRHRPTWRCAGPAHRSTSRWRRWRARSMHVRRTGAFSTSSRARARQDVQPPQLHGHREANGARLLRRLRQRCELRDPDDDIGDRESEGRTRRAARHGRHRGYFRVSGRVDLATGTLDNDMIVTLP